MKIGFCYGLFYDGYEDYEIYEGTAEGILGTAAWCPEAEHLAESSEIDFDNSAYLRVTLDSAEEVGLLLNKIQEIVTAKREEIIDLSTVSRDFRIAIKVNEQEVSFNRVINGKYTEDFFGSVSTEFYMLFLQALRDYIASGIQEDTIVDIPFDLDQELWRRTRLVHKRKA